MTEETQTAEETTADAVDTTVSDQTTTTETAASASDAAASATAEAASSETSASSSDSGPKSLREALEAGIDQGTKPRIKQSRDEEGKFKAETEEEKKAKEEADAAEAAKKAGKDGEKPEGEKDGDKKDEGKKEPDHLNDPIPEGLNKRTSERMKFLIDTVKAQNELVESHTALFDAVVSTGASPDEFATMINYMRGARSNDPAALETAYKVLQSELQGIAIRMGKPIFEVNLLRNAENADLIKEIQEGTLTTQRAHEIALQRLTNATNTKRQQVTKEAQTAEQTAEADKKAGMSDLDKFEEEMIARDGPDVARAKIDILFPQLKAAANMVNPRKWREMYSKAYDALKYEKPAPRTTTVTEQPKDKTYPQRPKSPAGGGNGAVRAEPKSALEAINAALE